MKGKHESPTAEAIGRVVKPLLALSDSLQETAKPQEVSSDNVRRIAIPVANGKLCLHFGHCQQFAMVDVDPEAKKVLGVEFLNPPPHEPGVFPKWVAEQGATLVISGGMGARAQSLFTDQGVNVLVGAQSATPEEVAQAYLDGSLSTGANICDH